MATFKRRGAKWQVQVRLHGHAPLSRTFTLKSDAEGWARQTEASIEREDPPGSSAAPQTSTLLQMLDDMRRWLRR
jgi:hypothetical protein